MKLVEDARHFARLTQDWRGAGCRQTNCYLLPGAIARLCTQKRLFVQDRFLLEEAGRFYKVYVWPKPGQAFRFPKPDKACVCTVLGRGTEPPEWEASLLASGFTFDGTSSRLTGTVDKERLADLKRRFDSPVTVVPARPEHLEGLFAVWDQAFDPLVHMVPSREDVLSDMEEGRVLAALSEDGRVIGTVRADFSAGYASGWHGAVAESSRGRLTGSALLLRYFELALERGLTRHQWWAVDANPGASSFQKRFGFTADGLRCWQYILR